MDRTKIIRPDGSEFTLTLEKSWSNIGNLCKFHGKKFYSTKGWYQIHPLYSIEVNPGFHELLLEDGKILMWRWTWADYFGNTVFYVEPNNLQIIAETREEAERKLKLLAFE